MIQRRHFMALGVMSGLAACARPVPTAAPAPVQHPPLPPFYGAITDEPHPVPALAEGSLAPEHWRQDVPNRWPDKVRGTIVVDPDNAQLFFVQDAATATRFGVSVGAEGFAWSGTARLQFMRDWPHWKVPDEMIDRKPDLAPYRWNTGGMPPGPENPMGARALYLFQGGVDTLYRVHGDAAPAELGKAVSSGCIRMLDQDVIHLASRAVHGAQVIVLRSMKPDRLKGIY